MTDDIEEILDLYSSNNRTNERISVILNELEDYWMKHPDLRLGQIIVNISNKHGFDNDPFYMEDDVVLRELKDRNEN